MENTPYRVHGLHCSTHRWISCFNSHMKFPTIIVLVSPVSLSLILQTSLDIIPHFPFVWNFFKVVSKFSYSDGPKWLNKSVLNTDTSSSFLLGDRQQRLITLVFFGQQASQMLQTSNVWVILFISFFYKN